MAGVFSYFGGPNLAMPYLLNLMHLPQDMFQLFLLTGVVEGRIGDALGAMHLVVFCLLSMCALTGTLTLNWKAIAKYCGAMAVSGISIQLALSALLPTVLRSESNESNRIAEMQLIREPVPAAVIRETVPNPEPLLPNETILERIRRRGVIRIGFNEDKLPFAYFNREGKLVGLDVDLAHAFARDLHVAIEFVRFDRDSLAEQLANDNFDIVMSGLVGTLERAEAMQHTDSHMTVTLALVVEDFRAPKFRTAALIRDSDLRIGYVDLSLGFVSRLRKALPNAELVNLQTAQQFFEKEDSELDALLVSAESGSAYTLLYPDFAVVIPKELKVSLPLFYAIGNRDEQMTDFLEHWITLRRDDGTVNEYYDYWILGKSARNQKPRWCVIRDVLHWVE